MRVGSVATLLVLTLAGCADQGQNPFYALLGPVPAAPSAAAANTAPATPVPRRAEAVLAARRCGTTLGIAARCNHLRDESDFAILRYAVLDGLKGRYGQAAGPGEIEETLDLAVLDRLTSIRACRVPPTDLPRVEAGVRTSLDACAAEGASALVTAEPANRSGQTEVSRRIAAMLAERSASAAVKARAGTAPEWGRLELGSEEVLAEVEAAGALGVRSSVPAPAAPAAPTAATAAPVAPPSVRAVRPADEAYAVGTVRAIRRVGGDDGGGGHGGW
jgi:hypothetical protein